MGCALCKTRHKKCDETKPQCLRCVSAGRTCTYDYVEYPESESYRVKRTRPANRTTHAKLLQSSQNATFSHSDTKTTSLLLHPASGGSALPPCTVPPEPQNNEVCRDPYIDSTPWEIAESTPHNYLGLPPVSLQSASNYNLGSIDTSATLDHALMICKDFSELDLVPLVLDPALCELALIDNESNYEDDPEGIHALWYTTPTMDKNVKDNTLPFVLQSYSRWALIQVFEPLKVVHSMRNQISLQFSSKNSREKTILIANVMNIFAKNLVLDSIGKSILAYLTSNVQKRGRAFLNAPPLDMPQLDQQNAMRMLDNILELLTVQVAAQPIVECFHLLDNAALVFRRACSEPPGQPINLPRMIMDPNLNLQHFATADVMRSLITGKPTYFRYDVPFSLDLCNQMHQLRDTHSLQWLRGVPDEFILLFAWINNLCETPGASKNQELITWIEEIVPRIQIPVSQIGDPLLRIAKAVAQESWRSYVRLMRWIPA
ncbi:hypothetical protein RSOLAG1IB_09989 [Rhizoctonia solani AG-1 IB]|uniref:Zn(2)-C6 fungal-type domain-containing protein n=1 Tax=Thanatephorus cucumeris (strain AG1-IB / isolate 7/3/14) TaxID=1108050 RepID=A0A0B7FTT1_THACB|nr:hypothetical protein RSOLAG1IB_09989 [Rhizoctonia solani AG-1 IB]